MSISMQIFKLSSFQWEITFVTWFNECRTHSPSFYIERTIEQEQQNEMSEHVNKSKHTDKQAGVVSCVQYLFACNWHIRNVEFYVNAYFIVCLLFE